MTDLTFLPTDIPPGLPPSECVKSVVLGLRKEFEILWIVIEPVLVDVMNDLVAFERTPEDPLDDDVVEVAPDRAVGCAALRASTARIARAENDDVTVRVDPRRPDIGYSPATVKLPERLGRPVALLVGSLRPAATPVPSPADLGVAIGLATLRDGRPERGREAAPATEFGITVGRASYAVGLRGRDAELPSADLADEFDRHNPSLLRKRTEGKKK